MAEPRTTLSTEQLERFLADRAPVTAPPPPRRRGRARCGRAAAGATRMEPSRVRRLVREPEHADPRGRDGRRRAPGRPARPRVRGATAARDPGSRMGAVVDRRNRDLRHGHRCRRAIRCSRCRGAAARPRKRPSGALTDAGLSWAPIVDQTPFAGASIRGFLQLDHSVLAYGSHSDAAGKETIATWASDDGASWRLLSDAGSVNPLDGEEEQPGLRRARRARVRRDRSGDRHRP